MKKLISYFIAAFQWAGVNSLVLLLENGCHCFQHFIVAGYELLCHLNVIHHQVVITSGTHIMAYTHHTVHAQCGLHTIWLTLESSIWCRTVARINCRCSNIKINIYFIVPMCVTAYLSAVCVRAPGNNSVVGIDTQSNLRGHFLCRLLSFVVPPMLLIEVM